MRRLTNILMVACLAAMASLAWAQEPDSGMSLGSRARQQLLKYRLRQIQGDTLAASLDHNRRQWDSLSPEQRQKVRETAYAFLRENDDRQRDLLAHYEQVIKSSAERRDAYQRRARWLRVVLASFSGDELQAMRQMTPTDRARKLLERRDQLVREGKLVIEPASQPATGPGPEPTSAPADQ
jgi:ElaB/YqjD/DUF883 family membrane-anchored ribosome-binding protein